MAFHFDITKITTNRYDIRKFAVYNPQQIGLHARNPETRSSTGDFEYLTIAYSPSLDQGHLEIILFRDESKSESKHGVKAFVESFKESYKEFYENFLPIVRRSNLKLDPTIRFDQTNISFDSCRKGYKISSKNYTGFEKKELEEFLVDFLQHTIKFFKMSWAAVEEIVDNCRRLNIDERLLKEVFPEEMRNLTRHEKGPHDIIIGSKQQLSPRGGHMISYSSCSRELFFPMDSFENEDENAFDNIPRVPV